MGGGQPFMYDAVPNGSTKHPYGSFDPRAASKASLTPKPAKPAPDGPLISFNRHPDSYIIAPYGNINAEPMNKSVKKRITQTRIVVLLLRIVQFLGAVGLLTMMILINNVAITTVWIMRIPPGIAIIHTIYGTYHLSRRPSGRTPASSASYMLFASGADASIIPFYAFSAIIAYSQYRMALTGTGEDDQWGTLLSDGSKYMIALTQTAFLCPAVAGALHLVSLGLSLWLAVTFRKISNLPPDMNPLEDNLTSRHKRHRSSISVAPTWEKRLSEPLETKRRSGAPYEEVSRPPTIPFLHTRTQSVDSFSTYESYDSRLDLPSRHYQIPSRTNSPRASMSDIKRPRDSRLDLPSQLPQILSSTNSPSASVSDLKRSSLATPPKLSKRGSYVEAPPADSSPNAAYANQLSNLKEAWYTVDTINGQGAARRSNPNPKKSTYQPIRQQRESMDMEDLSFTLSNAFVNPLGDQGPATPPKNPLGSHPPGPKHQSALVEISHNRGSTDDTAAAARQQKRSTTGNLGEASRDLHLARSNTGDVAATAKQLKRSTTGDLLDLSRNLNLNGNGTGDLADMSRDLNLDDPDSPPQNPYRSSQPLPPKKPFAQEENFKARFYGELKAGKPPVLVGASGAMRQTSTGNDFGAKGGFRTLDRRESSLKNVEDAKSGAGVGGWGARMRKTSGLAL